MRFPAVIALILLGCAILAASPEPARAAAFASAANVASFRQFLAALDARDRKSIPAARAELEKKFPNAPDSTASAAFRAFRKFYSTTVQTIDRTYFWQTPNNSAPRKDFQAALDEIMSGGSGRIDRVTPELLNSDPIQVLDSRDEAFRKKMREKYGATLDELRDYRKCGVWFYWGEGDWFAGEDAAYLAAAGAFLKGDLRDFLNFRMETAKARVAHDAALVIAWDELRRRIIGLENFANAHPKLPETDAEIRHELRHLTIWYLCGIGNTPAYSREGSHTIVPELRASYERFLAENRDSSLYPVVAKVYDLLKKHNFAFSRELEDYIKSSGFTY